MTTQLLFSNTCVIAITACAVPQGFSLPAGRYQALRVEIGAAEGHNWWCVLFPALCLAGEEELSATAMAQGLTGDDVALMQQERAEYEIRWRCVELWEELRAALEEGGSAGQS